jgi:hypothetical protein
MNEFDFMADQKYKALLKRDFIELQNCVDNKASKSVLILSGSIIETLLLEFFSHNLPERTSKAQLLRKSLAELIDLAATTELISTKSKELSTVIKNYRNLIHPGREIRTNEKFDYDTAIVSFSLVKIILKEIKEKYAQKYGYTAEDIFNKILVDSSTYSIFEKLIPKLNIHEKNKLLNLLVEYEIENYQFQDRGIHYRYIRILKTEIEPSLIHEYCKRLLREVEKGERHHIYSLFELFGSDIKILDEDEKNIILIYIYNKVNNFSAWNVKIEDNRTRTLFSFLGLYMDSPDIKQKFFDLLIKVVRNHELTQNTKWFYISTYNNMIAKFTGDEKLKCREHVKDVLGEQMVESFYTALEEDDDLPF